MTNLCAYHTNDLNMPLSVLASCNFIHALPVTDAVDCRVTTLQTMWNSLTIPWWFTALLPMLSVTHVMPVLEILSVVGVGMQQCIIQNQKEMHKLGKVKNRCKYAANNKQFLATYPWFLVKSLTYHWQLSKSLTFPGFPDKWLTCDLVTGRASACKKFCSNPKLLLFINFSAHMSQLSIDS